MASQKGPRRTSQPPKSQSGVPVRKCVGCGKNLPDGVRFCVSCGTHDEAELDSRIADLDRQVEGSYQRTLFHRWLGRLFFGFWRF